MSVSIQSWQHVEVPLGTPLAQVTPDGDLHIWPGGVGHGPMVSMSLADWEQIKHSADSAILVRRNFLAGYAAQEGNGYE